MGPTPTTEEPAAGRPQSRGSPALTSFLESRGIAYRLLTNGTREAADGMPASTCRGVLLRKHEGWRMAVIPLEESLDIAKARVALGEPRLRLATEHERATLFPEFARTPLPPIGAHYPHPDLVDGRLLKHAEVVCAGPLPEQRVAINPRSLVSATHAVVADLCE